MTLSSPLGLLALAALPLAVVAWRSARRPPAVRFTNLDVLASVATPGRSFRRWLPPVLALAALAALALAVARPVFGGVASSRTRTVVLALDTSGSMDATDVKPTRLVATERAALEFVARLPRNVRVGVVTFDEDAQVIAFPTRDRGLVGTAIRSLRPGARTAIGDGLGRAVDLLRETARGRGLVVLLSDGRNNAGRLTPTGAARDAAELGVHVDTIALGTWFNTGYGNPYDDLPDPDTLAAIAKLTGGSFASAGSADRLTGIYRGLGTALARLPKRHEATVAFVALAAILLAGSAAGTALWRPSLP